MAGSSPELKKAISDRMTEINGGDVEVQNVNEFVRILAFNEAQFSRTQVKQAIASMIYRTGHITRYHDKQGRRHFLLRQKYVAAKA